jgi:hypothetical protein
MRKYAILVMLICFIILIHGYSLAEAAEPKYSQTRDIMKSGEIKGTLQCDTGSLIVDAWVYTPGDSFTAVTDGAGNFILRFVPEGNYTLKISFDTGDGQIENVVVKSEMTTDLGLVKIICPVVNVCLGKKDGFPCDDNDICTANDLCKNGTCAGIPVDCNDWNPCIEDECVPVVGCTHQPLTGIACNDTNVCTANDVCSNGACAGTPIICNDWNPCTRDECDMKTGCAYQPLNGIPCDDGNTCTTQDACKNGVCNGDPITCDDNNPCTKDFCNVSSGCTNSPISDVPCDDAGLCTANDTCKNGACSGQPIDCNDGDSCTDDSCLPDKGCVHTRKIDPECSN